MREREREREIEIVSSDSNNCFSTKIAVISVIIFVSFPEFRNLSSFSLAVLKLLFLCTNKDSHKKYKRNLRTLHEKKAVLKKKSKGNRELSEGIVYRVSLHWMLFLVWIASQVYV